MLPDAHEATIDFSTTEDAELGIVVQEAGVEGGVARENEALTVLDYNKTRSMFLDDLAEVFCSSLVLKTCISKKYFHWELVGSIPETAPCGNASDCQRSTNEFLFIAIAFQH